MTDVALFHTADGGDVEITNGNFRMSDGLEAAAYLSMFGGNEDDGVTAADLSKQWWGNLVVTSEAQKMRSRTQYLLKAGPVTPARLSDIEAAAIGDLAWMTDELADSVSVLASMPALNTVSLAVRIDVGNQSYPFTFVKTGAQTA